MYQIGDIAVTSDSVMTPNWEGPLTGSVWIASDQSRTEEKVPSWAVIVAILTFWFTCFLGLLFLLVKEKRTTGYVEVRVQSGELLHMTQIPAQSAAHVDQVRGQVGQIQAFARQPR